MNTISTVVSIATGLIALGIVYVFYRKIQGMPAKSSNDQSLLIIQKQVESLSQQMNANLTQVSKTMMDQLRHVTEQVNSRLKENMEVIQNANATVGERLDTAAKSYSVVTAKLAELHEANRRIYDVGKDIASLQEILRSPKLRGTLGEFFLGDLLSQILPPEHYALQHRFKSGEIVDAVIKFRDSLVPVDAKFPLENFKKMIESSNDNEKHLAQRAFVSDVKKHIDKIAKLYILPDEGTLQIALMYIPAENVYYETVIKEREDNNLINYAHGHRVIPVSPNSFYVYLQTILLGLRGMQIEKSAQEILATLGKLRLEFEKFSVDYHLVGKHLTHAKNAFDDTEKRLDKFETHLTQVTAPQEGALPAAPPEDILDANS
ncbi:MAG: hypothetical protein HW383_360 [Candidatus Magasanikbacteria bacterium]|nr:hypothetical protein [Candidatus Magasanikbacteria bacterium]